MEAVASVSGYVAAPVNLATRWLPGPLVLFGFGGLGVSGFWGCCWGFGVLCLGGLGFRGGVWGV